MFIGNINIHLTMDTSIHDLTCVSKTLINGRCVLHCSKMTVYAMSMDCIATIICLLPLCLCSSSNISLLIVVDEVVNDSVIAAVERTIDIINNDNDTLPQYLLQYTTDQQVCCMIYSNVCYPLF